jgi:hypothetical protein
VIKGVWGEAMRQIGNAVPVLLAEKIGHKLIKTLDTHTLKIPVVKSPIVPLFRQERSDLLNTLSASANP